MEAEQMLDKFIEWRKDVFAFAEARLGGIRPAEPLDDLKGAKFERLDTFGRKVDVIFFDYRGRLIYPDLSFYELWMFKDQTRAAVIGQNRFTWQQTVAFEAYNRAINTFGQDSFEEVLRWITIRSGHGIGKTSFLSVVALHFLVCFFHSQVGVTANTEQQLKDIFLKELYMWRGKLDENLRGNIEILDDTARISMEKDWFLRARVARPEKPEALAGLHGEFILILVDEASAIAGRIFEVMKGSLTGKNFIVIYTGNPTRTEGEFYESHKPSAKYTKLHFNSRHSPIVEEGYIDRMEADYPSSGDKKSDEVLIRVDGEFAGEAEMDTKGWIPLFANVQWHFEPQQGQIINRAIIGIDPAGAGKDRSIIHIRDSIYLKEVLNETTSSEFDLARKIETIREVYHCSSNDIGIDAFGIGAKVLANVNTKMGESVRAILTDKPREEVKDKYHTYKSELGWKFREWVARGGIIITNNPAHWQNELGKVKYKRDPQGRIMLMPKVEFKKDYGFSPDRFDAACMTFFKDEPTSPVILTKEEMENKEMYEWKQKAAAVKQEPNYSGF